MDGCRITVGGISHWINNSKTFYSQRKKPYSVDETANHTQPMQPSINRVGKNEKRIKSWISKQSYTIMMHSQ